VKSGCTFNCPGIRLGYHHVILRQVHNLFQREFSRKYDQVLRLSISTNISHVTHFLTTSSSESPSPLYFSFNSMLQNAVPMQYVTNSVSFNVHGSVYRESMSIIVQQDATTSIYNLLYLCKLLYMFRVVTPPIIRSTCNCNYSIWHWSNFGKCSV